MEEGVVHGNNLTLIACGQREYITAMERWEKLNLLIFKAK